MKARVEKDKELADRGRLLRAWKRWHAELMEQALAGVHGAVLERLMAQLKDLRSARRNPYSREQRKTGGYHAP